MVASNAALLLSILYARLATLRTPLKNALKGCMHISVLMSAANGLASIFQLQQTPLFVRL